VPPTHHNFDVAHVTVIVLTFATPFILAWIVRRRPSGRFTAATAWCIAGFLVANAIAQWVYHLATGQMNTQRAMPMQLCDQQAVEKLWRAARQATFASGGVASEAHPSKTGCNELAMPPGTKVASAQGVASILALGCIAEMGQARFGDCPISATHPTGQNRQQRGMP
jgi:hypothetical protein